MTPTAILATLADAGVQLFVAAGQLRFRAHEGAYTTDLRALVNEHRNELVVWLTTPGPAGSNPEPAIKPEPTREVTTDTAKPNPSAGAAVCRCGSAEFRDVEIHGGQSARRDCARCQQFISFPRWYGMVAQ